MEKSATRKNRPVTIIDIARETGVSYSTVSRVLSGFEFVKEETRQRVLEAAKRLGYVAHAGARSLAGGRANIIGLLVPGLDNGYVGEVARGIDEELSRVNYNLMLYTTHRQQSKEPTYVRSIANGLTDGLILLVPLVTDYLRELQAQGFPYVLVDQSDPSGQSTVVDATNWQGAYDATEYLIGLGHRRIGFIAGMPQVASARERLEGYKAALRKHGIEFDPSLVAQGNFWQLVGYQAASALLDQEQPPTAIFASNDLSAFGAMEAILERGLRIPEDISIVGFDDIPQASLVYPKLTTVRQPLDEMGRIAVRLLLEQIEEPSLPARRVTLPTQLIVRDSCQRIG
ncbi:MAG: LacI family transcriptional regulator [Candidatus Thermofonsia Clade 1 bacterium]|uniref:LacI family transcriptional regulator n=2 Tax=Candidatus Thermofonsia Clade 1 bacterium TaxID=2364210 RepID=A0A2M8PXI0_9CHLR|nr:MAG: LacI family transcriptional regulator [Candidatus Thermofonsia Clade 1 bacterium]